MKRKIIVGSAFLLTFGCFSVYCYGQQSPPAVSQDKETKAVYVPVRTKSDLAVQRLQKREAIELQKRNDLELEYRTINEKPALIRAAEKQPSAEKVEIYRERETPVKLEKKVQIKEEQKQQPLEELPKSDKKEK